MTVVCNPDSKIHWLEWVWNWQKPLELAQQLFCWHNLIVPADLISTGKPGSASITAVLEKGCVENSRN